MDVLGYAIIIPLVPKIYVWKQFYCSIKGISFLDWPINIANSVKMHTINYSTLQGKLFDNE